jgi:hypothetical protein
MAATPGAHYQKVSEELDRYLKVSEDFRRWKVERAFIEWYIKARFGNGSNFTVVDGAGDGGIDAIGDDGETITVLQMKYEKRPRLSALSSDEVGDFERVHEAFEKPLNFEEYIKTVREDLKKSYKKSHSDILSKKRKVRFVLVTTKRNTFKSRRIEFEDATKILSLWDLYNEGFTPPVPSIELRLENAWPHRSSQGNFVTYVGLADTLDFLKLMDNDANERLFAQNVRTDLKTSINKEIQLTYENEPSKFWLGNNGVYIVCKAVTNNEGIYSLVYPSIINGSQSLHSIARSSKKHSCKILVRILAMDVTGDRHLLGEVVRRTNTQNPMKSINLVAHDSSQLSIARYLDQFQIFYERREKEWKNEKKRLLQKYLMVNLKDMGQWLSVLDSGVGLGRARSRVSELFQGKFYRTIFGAFDPDFESSKYSQLVNITWAGLMVKNLLKRVPKNKNASVKIPQLLFVKLFYDAVEGSFELENFMSEALRRQMLIKGEIPKKLIRLVTEIADDFEKIQKTRQKKDENLDYSNFFKRDKESEDAYFEACSSSRRKLLAKLLLASLRERR